MYNTFLNRYYITSVNRAIAFAETQDKVQGLLGQGKIGEQSFSGTGKSVRGKQAHEKLQRELQGLWMRHLVKEEEQKECNSFFCKGR